MQFPSCQHHNRQDNQRNIGWLGVLLRTHCSAHKQRRTHLLSLFLTSCSRVPEGVAVIAVILIAPRQADSPGAARGTLSAGRDAGGGDFTHHTHCITCWQGNVQRSRHGESEQLQAQEGCRKGWGEQEPLCCMKVIWGREAGV